MLSDKNSTNKDGCQQPTKAELRRRILARRAQMSPAERARASAAATRRVTELSVYRSAESVALFLSAGDEIDTWGLLEEAWQAGKTVWAPRVDREARLLRWGRVTNRRDDLEPGSYKGILEPRHTVAALEMRPDVVIVPGAVFDGEGYRIGYGGGYYDRCLAGWPRVPRVGFAFECQRVERVPREPHDLPVHYLVTEEAVYRFHPSYPL